MRTLRAKALCLLPLLAAILTTPVSAQEVELEELRGATVSVTLVRSQRLLGGNKEGPARFEDAMEFTFGPDDVRAGCASQESAQRQPLAPEVSEI